MGMALAAALAAIVAIGAVVSCDARRRLRRASRMLADCREGRAAAAATARRARAETLRLREALDAVPVAIWRRDGAGALAECNRAYAEWLSISREAALANNAALVLRGSARRPAAAGGISTFAAHVVIGGARRSVEIGEAPAAGGGTIGFAVDRTAVEQAQAELRRHLAAHDAVLEGLSAAIAIFGADRRLGFFNTAYAELWRLDGAWLAAGPTLAEVLDRLHQSRRFPEYPDFAAFKDERSAEFNSLIEPRRELVHLPDGRTLQWTTAPHPLGGLAYVYDDVSDRLALECSFNTLAQVQRATLDHLFEGIAVYGADGRLKLYNPAFCALWELSGDDVAGGPHIREIADKTRAFLDAGGDWGRVREDTVARVTAPSLASGPLYRGDGSVLQVASVPLPDGAVLMSYLDISDTARVERALRQRNEALEAAGRLKTEFVATLSHDLRTPLNTIQGFAEILHNQYFGLLNPSQREYTSGIVDSARQLLALIGDMIDLATIEAGELGLERGCVDVAGLLNAVVGLVRERAQNRGLTLETRCPPGIGTIDGDERRLKQALFNLVSNAVKFTPPGGAVAVEAERRGGELLLGVADCGSGIPAAGPPCAPAEVASGPRHAEWGLGLALVRRLIELHGGAVEAEASPGRGTRIVCRVPIGHPAATPSGASVAACCAPADSPHRAAA